MMPFNLEYHLCDPLIDKASRRRRKVKHADVKNDEIEKNKVLGRQFSGAKK